MCKTMSTKGKQNDEEGASKYQIHVITREMNTKSGLEREREDQNWSHFALTRKKLVSIQYKKILERKQGN